MKDRWTPTTRYFVIGLVLIFVVFVIWQIREIFTPLITAGLIAYIFFPFVEMLRRWFKLSQGAASRIVFFFILALIIFVPVSLAPTLYRELEVVVTDLVATMDDLEALLVKPIVIANFQLSFSTLIPDLRNSLAALQDFLPEDAFRIIESTSRGTLWFLVILVSTYYFMTDWDKLRDWVIQLAPTDQQHDLRRLYLQIKAVWMGYLRGQLTLMTIVAIVFGILWSIIGLPGALVLGILAGVFSLIPDVGPFRGNRTGDHCRPAGGLHMASGQQLHLCSHRGWTLRGPDQHQEHLAASAHLWSQRAHAPGHCFRCHHRGGHIHGNHRGIHRCPGAGIAGSDRALHSCQAHGPAGIRG